MSLIKQGGILPMKKIIVNSNNDIEITKPDGSMYNPITTNHTRQYYRAIAGESINTIVGIYDALLEVEYWAFTDELEGANGVIGTSLSPKANEILCRKYLESFVGKSNGSPLSNPPSYKINTIRTNNEYIDLTKDYLMPETWFIECFVRNDIDDNSQRLLSSADGIAGRISFLAPGKIQLNGSNGVTHLSPSYILPATGEFLLSLDHLIDKTTKVYVNKVLVYTIPIQDTFYKFQFVGRSSFTYFGGAFNLLNLNNDIYLFNEGSGSQTISSNGEVANLISNVDTEAMWEEL